MEARASGQYFCICLQRQVCTVNAQFNSMQAAKDSFRLAKPYKLRGGGGFGEKRVRGLWGTGYGENTVARMMGSGDCGERDMGKYCGENDGVRGLWGTGYGKILWRE